VLEDMSQDVEVSWIFFLLFPQRLSDEANELLPIFNKTSSRFYKATVPTGDWSNQVKRKKSGTPIVI
jgi:pyruvate dehydrogenase kinase 2/3/4